MLNREEIKRRREYLGLTLDQAAKLAGIKGGRAKWHDIESGRNANPSMKTLIGMARALRWSSLAKLVTVKGTDVAED